MATYKDGFHIASAAEMEELLAESMTSGGKTSEQIKAAGALSLPNGEASTDSERVTSNSTGSERGSSNPVATTQTETAFKYEPLKCDNIVDFHELFWPDVKLHDWQREMLYQLSGFTSGDDEGDIVDPTDDSPLLYSLVAANGSGKSAIIIARFVLWFIATQNNAIAVVTSATFAQLKDLTFRAIHRAAQDINDLSEVDLFELTEVQVKCTKTRSFVKGFATDQPGRAEGWHPESGAKMAVVIDEAKTITDEMFQAFSRFSGFSHWIEVSSPGPMSGHFYERTSSATRFAGAGRVSDILTLNEIYHRRVTAFENPHIKQAHIDQLKLLCGGETGALYRSSILAEFTSLEDSAVIRQEITRYSPPQWNDYGLERKAGLDISLGGDETVLSVWHGNKRIAQDVWRLTDSKHLVRTLIKAFIKHGLKSENINADGGGLGKVVVQMIRAEGWEINSINNESAALYKKEFLNRGMEMYWKVMRLIEEQILILPLDDTICMTQLTTRKYEIVNGKQRLESKSKLTKSPDRSDAMVLAFATVDLAEILLTHKALKDSTKPKFTQIAEVTCPTLEQYEAYIEAKRAKALEGGAGNGLVQHLPVGRVTYSARTSGMAGSRLSTFIKSRKGSGNIPRIGR